MVTLRQCHGRPFPGGECHGIVMGMQLFEIFGLTQPYPFMSLCGMKGRRGIRFVLRLRGCFRENSADRCSQAGRPGLECYERVEVCLEEVRGEEYDSGGIGERELALRIAERLRNDRRSQRPCS